MKLTLGPSHQFFRTKPKRLNGSKSAPNMDPNPGMPVVSMTWLSTRSLPKLKPNFPKAEPNSSSTLAIAGFISLSRFSAHGLNLEISCWADLCKVSIPLCKPSKRFPISSTTPRFSTACPAERWRQYRKKSNLMFRFWKCQDRNDDAPLSTYMFKNFKKSFSRSLTEMCLANIVFFQVQGDTEHSQTLDRVFYKDCSTSYM